MSSVVLAWAILDVYLIPLLYIDFVCDLSIFICVCVSLAEDLGTHMGNLDPRGMQDKSQSTGGL